MFKLFNFNKNKAPGESDEQHTSAQLSTAATPAPQTLFQKLKNKLTKTSQGFSEKISNLFLGKKEIDSEVFQELETILLSADLGIDTTQQVLDEVASRVARKELADTSALLAHLKQVLHSILQPTQVELQLTSDSKPFVILVAGVNGAGKTTTIGKLAKIFQSQGKKVMLAAGDTFRAAAIEQLQEWGARNSMPVIAQHPGSDSAAVIYDAISSATAKEIDVVLADTAGRLHTQDHLMNELAKITKVIKKIDVDAPHETLLVLDASIGQNALLQAIKFHDSIKVTGLIITKLDGTAKGGVIFAIANALKLPIRYIGVGEGIDDLLPFNASEFIDALFDKV